MIGCIEIDARGHVRRFFRLKEHKTDNELDRFNTAVNIGYRVEEVQVDYSRTDECYYAREVGFYSGWPYMDRLVEGVRHKVWLADGVGCTENGKGGKLITKRRLKAMGLDLIDDKPEVPSLIWEDAYWCERCSDFRSESEHCDHVYWCRACSGGFKDKKTEACEHYCPSCEQEKGYSSMCDFDCDAEEEEEEEHH